MGVAEVGVGQDGQSAQFLLRPDDLAQQLGRHAGLFLETAEDDAADLVEPVLVDDGLQVAVDGLGTGFVVILEEQDAAADVGHEGRAMQEIERALVPADDGSLCAAFVDYPQSLVFPEPQLGVRVAPVMVGLALFQRVRRIGEQAGAEALERVVERIGRGEGAEVRSGVGDEPGAGVDGGGERGHVREAAQDLGMVAEMLVVDVRKELVGVVAAAQGDDRPDLRIGEGVVQVADALLHGGGAEGIGHVEVVGVGDRESQGFQPFLRGMHLCPRGYGTAVQVGHGRGYDADGVAGLEFGRNDGFHGIREKDRPGC